MPLILILVVIDFALTTEVIGCGTGYYSVYPDLTSCECEPCPKGTYNNKEFTDSCTSCPSGWTTFQSGTVNYWECQQVCGQGNYSAKIGPYTFDRECRMCPIGSYSDTDNATSCSQCLEGETTDQEGSTSCRPICQKGYRVNDASDGCTICPNSTYSDTIDAGSCKSCGMYHGSSQTLTGQVSEAGSTSSSECLCPPGFYFTFHVHNARACRNCFSGFYSANFTRPNERCIACPIYQITAQRASTSITQCKDIDRVCEPGHYFLHIFVRCKPCPSGTYSPDGGPCRGCAEGFTTIGNGAISADNCTDCSSFTDDNPRNSTDSCERCPFGFHPWHLNASQCTFCVEGRTTDESHRTCVCLPGYHYPRNQGLLGRCILCPQGTYKSNTGNEECTSCPEGATTVKDSVATSLDNCTSPA